MVVRGTERLGEKSAGVVRTPDGDTLFVSYGTVIGVSVAGGAPAFTEQKFSPTTTRHRNDFMRSFGGRVIDARRFADLVRGVGFSPERDEAPSRF